MTTLQIRRLPVLSGILYKKVNAGCRRGQSRVELPSPRSEIKDDDSVFISSGNNLKAGNGYVRDNSGNWLFEGNKITDKNILARINRMKLPPAWNNVVVSKEIKDKVQAIGMDKAGRWQYRYSESHINESALKKFNRSKLFSKDISKIRNRMEKDILKNDSRAYLLRLEDKTAIRAGSAVDFKARKKAYGLTTLLNKHVKVKGDDVFLSFTAKEGIPVKYKLKDSVLSKWLSKRKTGLAPSDSLFPDVHAGKLNNYIREISGGKKYTIKDYRTFHGTRIAYSDLKKYAGKEYSNKQKKEIVKKITTTASKFLKNTPVMAKNSYIDPMVWELIGGID